MVRRSSLEKTWARWRGEGCVEERDWILVLDLNLIQGPIVNARAQGSIFLLHKEELGPTIDA